MSSAQDGSLAMGAGECSNVVQLEDARDRLFGAAVPYRDLLNALPAAVYTTDADGRITFYNDAAVEFAGRRPELGELWCVTWRLYNLDGTHLPHDECPMAVALKEARPVRGAEAIAERPDGSRITFAPYPTPLFGEDGALIGAINMLVDITERKQAEVQHRRLANEVNHRANNLLSVVLSLVRLTTSDHLKGDRESLEGRIAALARSHNMLAKSYWRGADLQALVCEELAPHMAEQPRAWLSGPHLPLGPEAAQAFTLVLHELATNAARHGALSNGAGRVMVEWRQARGDTVLLRWQEERGPLTVAPTAAGVGSTIIERAAAQLGAEIRFDWRPAGLVFEFRVASKAVIGSQPDTNVHEDASALD